MVVVVGGGQLRESNGWGKGVSAEPRGQGLKKAKEQDRMTAASLANDGNALHCRALRAAVITRGPHPPDCPRDTRSVTDLHTSRTRPQSGRVLPQRLSPPARGSSEGAVRVRTRSVRAASASETCEWCWPRAGQ